ncbi:hypothetical protein ERJ75_001318200 [Trypanosoma vivax]|nr:hypothetical protein ERJ75_001318200 [Trypanosoma vivax]
MGSQLAGEVMGFIDLLSPYAKGTQSRDDMACIDDAPDGPTGAQPGPLKIAFGTLRTGKLKKCFSGEEDKEVTVDSFKQAQASIKSSIMTLFDWWRDSSAVVNSAEAANTNCNLPPGKSTGNAVLFNTAGGTGAQCDAGGLWTMDTRTSNNIKIIMANDEGKKQVTNVEYQTRVKEILAELGVATRAREDALKQTVATQTKVVRGGFAVNASENETEMSVADWIAEALRHEMAEDTSASEEHGVDQSGKHGRGRK